MTVYAIRGHVPGQIKWRLSQKWVAWEKSLLIQSHGLYHKMSDYDTFECDERFMPERHNHCLA